MSLILDGTNGVSDIDGSASTPAIRGTDTNTGIFFPAADTIAFSEGGAESMRIDSSGNLGIGTTSPGSNKLHVRGTTSEVLVRAISVSPTGNGVYGQYNAKYDGTDRDWYFGQSSTGSYGFWFNTGAVTYAGGFDNSGRFTVNTTSALNSALITTKSTNNVPGMSIWNAAGTSGFYSIMDIYNAAGNTRIGGITKVNDNAVTFDTTSDYRLKDNIKPMIGALDKVLQLNPVTYQWKADGTSGQGFVAHELQEIVPECVIGTKDAIQDIGNLIDENGNIVSNDIAKPFKLEKNQTWEKTGEKPIYQGIDTSNLVATLTAAIQELKSELDSVKAELATLKA